MKIYVTWIGDSRDKSQYYTFHAKLSDSVRSFKGRIQSQTNIPYSRQCLVSGGRLLEDDRTVADLVLSVANLVAEKGALQNVKVCSSKSSEMNGRGGVCVAVNPETGRWLVQLDSHFEQPKFQADFAPEDLRVLSGSFHHPWLLYEDFEGHANPHDVKVLISPTILMKFGHHNLSEHESASRPKTRVFSLQVECGTYTLWYSKTMQEAVPFFSAQKPMESTEFHHTMPLLGVVDLQDASMYVSDAPDVDHHFLLTIVLSQKDDQPPDLTTKYNRKLSQKYFYCIKKWEALRIVFRSQPERRDWIKTLQSCNVLLGIVCLMQS
jgi:hypothetical protein